jgi:hypothetical protein
MDRAQRSQLAKQTVEIIARGAYISAGGNTVDIAPHVRTCLDCPIIRNDDGTLLDEPQLASFITSPAPNAGAASHDRPEELPLIPEVFRRRSEYVLALAASHGYKRLVPDPR